VRRAAGMTRTIAAIVAPTTNAAARGPVTDRRRSPGCPRRQPGERGDPGDAQRQGRDQAIAEGDRGALDRRDTCHTEQGNERQVCAAETERQQGQDPDHGREAESAPARERVDGDAERSPDQEQLRVVREEDPAAEGDERDQVAGIAHQAGDRVVDPRQPGAEPIPEFDADQASQRDPANHAERPQPEAVEDRRGGNERNRENDRHRHGKDAEPGQPDEERTRR